MAIQNEILELIPLGAACVDTLCEEKGRLAPALDVRPEWCHNKRTAALYEEWQRLARQEDRWEWIMQKQRIEPLIVQATEASSSGIITARDAVIQMRRNWIWEQENNLLGRLTSATEGKDKLAALDKLQALYGATDSQAYEVDLTNPPPANECMLEREGVPLLPRCEVSAIKAKAKSGKTHLGQWWAAAAIGENVGRFTRPDEAPPRRVLFIDTEQSKRSSYKTMRNITRMAGRDPTQPNPFLTVWNLRSLHTDQRMPFLQGMVATGKYDLVILDGIKDLTKDINDNQEADRVLNSLTSMVETYNIALLTVLHENPSKDADKMRGHLGTELLNKAFDVFEISLDRDAGVFNILHTDSRDKPVPLWAFRFNDDDELEECEPTKRGDSTESQSQSQKRETKEEKEQRLWKQFRKAFEDNDSLSLREVDIIKNLQVKTGMKRGTVQNRIAEYLNLDYLRYSDDTKRYELAPQKLSEWRIEKAIAETPTDMPF